MAWVTVGVAIYSVYASNNQANAMHDAGVAQRRIADMNAKYAELDAYNAIQDGYTESNRYQENIDKTVGVQKTTLASQNVDVTFGTAADIQTDTKLTGYLNQLDILNQANSKALGLRHQSANYQASGRAAQDQAEMNANATRNAGLISAVATGYSGYQRTYGTTNNSNVTGYNMNGTNPKRAL